MEGDLILFLTKSRLSFLFGGRVLYLEFPTNIISEMDVRDRDGLINLISNFININKIVPSRIFFILGADICFTTDFPVADPANTAQIDSSVASFVDAIPFNYVISKIYKAPKNYRVIGANQDLIDAIADVFVSKGFGLTALVPALIYPKFASATELTNDFAKTVLDSREFTITSSMISEQPVKGNELTVTKPTKKPINYRLIALASAFILLVIILIVLVLVRR